MRRRKGPKKKPLHIAGKKRAMELLGVKRLSPTKAERRKAHAALEGIVGHKIPKLSDLVKKPSRYRVKKRQVIYDTKTETIPGERRVVGYRDGWLGPEPIYEYGPSKKVVVSKTPIGEKLIVKRVTKGGSTKASSVMKKGSRKTGSAVARRSKRIGGKRGKRTEREKKKKKEKR